MNLNVLFSNSAKIDCWGGVEKWTIVAAQAIIKNGGNAYIICRKDSVVEKKAKKANIQTFTASYTNSLDYFSVLTISDIIKKQAITTVICSTNLDIKLAGVAGRRANIPVISRQGLALIPNKLKYQLLIKNVVSSIITNTVTIKQQYEEYGWFPKDIVQVIYNGVEIEKYTIQEQEILELRRELSIPINKKILLSCGRLNQQKGFSFLIETARMASENDKDWYFLIIGNGQLEEELRSQINKYRLDNIQLLGFKNDVRKYYALSDIFLLSSLAEGIPNVVLEAMTHKLPVIATDVNGVKEVISHNKNGFIVPAKEPEEMYAAVSQLIEDSERLKSFASNGYQTVVHDFSMEQFTHKFMNYLNEVTENHAKNHHKNA